MLALLVLASVTACSAAGPGDTAPAASRHETSTATPTAEPTTGQRQDVASRLVAVVGMREADAVDLLTRLDVQTEIERRPGCATDVVVAQSPGPRGVLASGSVTLTVESGSDAADCDLGPVREQARALIGWARGEADPPAFADDVEFLVGDQTVERRLQDPLDRRAWELCEHGEGCSSPLTVLGKMARPAVVRVMTGSCADSYSLLRNGLAETLGRSVTVVDRRARSGCGDTVGVQVWVDTDRRISAVNWVL